MNKIIITLAALLMVSFTFAQEKGYKVGDIATSFNLLNIDGEMVSPADYEDAKGFIVTFTCNHCPWAVAYEDRIIALDQMFKEKGYPVIAIQPNDTELMPADSYENMQVRAKDKGFTFPYLLDKDQSVTVSYGASKTPHMYVLEKSKKGELVVQYIGAIDNNAKDAKAATKHYVQDAVNALLAGEEVPVTYTRAVGCSI